jgi:hypothetical protein
MKKRSIVAGIMALVLLTGCGPSFVSLDPLDLKKNNYPKTNNNKDVAFAIARPQLIVKTKISTDLNRGLSGRLQYDVNEIACHLTSEIQKMLVARGIDITDTFDNKADMTFTQKRETTALLYPVIVLELQQHSSTEVADGRVVQRTTGEIKVKATTTLVMLEPLSGEKIWIKHVSDKKMSIRIDYPGLLHNNTSPFQVQESVAQVAQDIDKLLIKVDNEILSKVNKFVTKEEFTFLNDDIKKLKNIKRY